MSYTALVTGGTSGIGEALVARMVAEGAVVYTTGRSQSRFQQAVQRTPALASARFRAVDMRNHQALVELVQEITAAGKLDVLVHNAGLMWVGPTDGMDAEQVDEHLDVLLHGPIHLTQVALKAMVAAGGGQIVSIASAAAIMPSPQMAVYAAAKAGLLHFTRSIAAEYASRGIRANVICPGPVDTGIAPRPLLARLASQAPAGRLARPTEIADLVLFLLGPRGSYINGSVFDIDGGLHLGMAPSVPESTSPSTVAGDVLAPAAPVARPELNPEHLAAVSEIFGEVLRFPDATPSTTPEEVAKWDSLGHLRMVAALEQRFALQFEVDEVMEMATVGDIVEIVTRKLAGK